LKNPKSDVNNDTNFRSENHSRGEANRLKNTTNKDINLTKNLIKNNSNPDIRISNKPKIVKENNNNYQSIGNESSDYVVFQNPNHNILPDYAEVLKNIKNKHENKNKINSKNKNQVEESIFNLGKPQKNSNNQISIERENFTDTYNTEEDNFREEDFNESKEN